MTTVPVDRELVERVAEALYRNEGGMDDEEFAIVTGGHRKHWQTDAPWDTRNDELAEHERDDFRAMAKVAIEIVLAWKGKP